MVCESRVGSIGTRRHGKGASAPFFDRAPAVFNCACDPPDGDASQFMLHPPVSFAPNFLPGASIMMQLIKHLFSRFIFASFARSPSSHASLSLSGMRKPLTQFCLLAGLAMVAACGPSEPESDEPAVEISEQVADAASDMRTGATGSPPS